MLISDFPIYEGENYAPVKPLLELHETRSRTRTMSGARSKPFTTN
jgi:hypothetical protein